MEPRRCDSNDGRRGVGEGVDVPRGRLDVEIEVNPRLGLTARSRVDGDFARIGLSVRGTGDEA